MSDSPSTPYEPVSQDSGDPAPAAFGADQSVGEPMSGQGLGPPRPAGRRDRRLAPPKLYRIGEVVEYSGVSRQTVHNYTTMGLLQERRWTPGGHRLYDESVFERLEIISEMKSQRRSLQDIREYFENVKGGGEGGMELRPARPPEPEGPDAQKPA